MKRDDHNDPFHDADKCKWSKSRTLAGYPGRDGIKSEVAGKVGISAKKRAFFRLATAFYGNVNSR
jgi:hypothetical protein